MGNDDFLKQLQNSLISGQKNENIVDRMKEISEKASKMTGLEAAEKIDKRIKAVGEVKKATEEEFKESEEEFIKLLAEQKENDEKLRLLAEIEQHNIEIEKIKFEFEKVKKKYSSTIEAIRKNKITLIVKFEKKYGEKAEDNFDFGPEQNTNLE